MKRLVINQKKFWAKLICLSFSVMLITNCSKQETIRVLSWSGYEEKEIKEYIEAKIPGVKLEFVTFTGGEDMLRKYESNKTNFDFLIVDAEYGKILFDKGELSIINVEKRPSIKTAINSDYFEKFKNTSENIVPGHTVDGDIYCLTVRWGTLGLVGKESLRDEIENEGYNVLLSEKYQRQITIFDWYLPNMGIFSLMYLDNKGLKKNPYDLSNSEIDEMYNTIMRPMRSNINNFFLELGLVIENTYKEQTAFVPGIGEWAIGNNMLNGDMSRDWYIPKQGGIMFIEAFAIPKHTESNPEKLEKVYSILELFTSVELQSKLAWRKAYTAHVPNKNAYKSMTEKQREILKYSEIEEILDGLHFRKVPENNTVEWINAWSKFKNNR